MDSGINWKALAKSICLAQLPQSLIHA